MSITEPGQELDGGRSADEPASGKVGDELRALWESASDQDIYRWLAAVAAPRLASHLTSKLDLQEADCDDCVSTAFDRFQPAVKSRSAVAEPYAYFFKIGINAALELLRERSTDPVIGGLDPSSMDVADNAHMDTRPSEVDPTFAFDVVEEAAADVEVEEFWAVEVVRLAVDRLGPAQRRVIEVLMYENLAFEAGGKADFAYSAEVAGSQAGTSAGAFRVAKLRAYEALRKSIPAIIVELGLNPPERAEASIFPSGRDGFMDDEL